MADVVGIICEYDPFHTGHQRQFSLIRERLPNARIVCVMSGCFTQRGMPALYAPAFRAHAALRAGADLVLELPALFALRDGERFALGGVSILHQLGFVTHISFGCENENLSLLSDAAAVLEQADDLFSASLKTHLQTGKPFAAAQGLALAEALKRNSSLPIGEEAMLPALLASPNNILAICYLRALLRLRSPIQPLPVLRVGAYHSQALTDSGFPSATAVRQSILRGDFDAAENACDYTLPKEPLCLPAALDNVLLAKLRQMNLPALAALPDCSEGLEHLLYRSCREATDRASLLNQLKSKRYTYARLNRLLAHAFLDITQDLSAAFPLPPYVRLLGLRKESEYLLSAMRKNPFPLIAKAADGPENPAYALDIRAYDAWALGAKIPAGLMLRQPVQVL